MGLWQNVTQDAENVVNNPAVETVFPVAALANKGSVDFLNKISGGVNSVPGLFNNVGNAVNGMTPHMDFQAQNPGILNQQDFKAALANANRQNTLATGAQNSFASALMGNYGQTYGQQQGLINQLQQEAQGRGPGTALAQNLQNQALQANIANAAGQIASTKGINPAIAARMAAQNAANLTQQSAGQTSALGLQNQLNAQGQLGGLLGQQAALSAGGAQNLLGNVGAQNVALSGQVQGANTAQNQLASQQNLAAQQLNQQTAIENMKAKSGVTGGLLNAGGGILAGAVGSGGLLSGLFGGGGAGADAAEAVDATEAAAWQGGYFDDGGKVPGKARAAGDHPKNDTVKAKLSPGEIVIPRSAAGNREAAIKFLEKTMKGKPGWDKKMASGGQVQSSQPDPFDTYSNPTNSSGLINQATGGNYAEGGEVEEDDTPDTEPGQAEQIAASQSGNVLSNLFKPLISAGSSMTGAPQGQAPAPQQDDSEEVQTEAPSLTQATAQKGPITMVSTPAGPDQAQPGPMDSPYLQQLQGDYGQYAEGVKNEAAAQEKQAKAISDVYKTSQDNMAKFNQDFATKYNDLDQENKMLTQKVMSGQLDPNRVWKNTSTGGKIAAGIGMLLSGIGSGLTGQRNMAMDVINNTIDKDIEAQRYDLGKTNTLLSMNLQKYGRLDHAYEITKNQELSMVQAKIAQIAATSQSPIAAAKAQQALAQLDMQKTQSLQNLAFQMKKYQALSGQDVYPASATWIAPENAVPLPGNQTIRFAPNAADAKVARDSLQAYAPVQDWVQRMNKAIGEGPTGVYTTANQKSNDLYNEGIRVLNSYGQATRNEDIIKATIDRIPKPGRLRGDEAAAQMQDIQRSIDAPLNAAYARALPGYNPGFYNVETNAPQQKPAGKQRAGGAAPMLTGGK